MVHGSEHPQIGERILPAVSTAAAWSRTDVLCIRLHHPPTFVEPVGPRTSPHDRLAGPVRQGRLRNFETHILGLALQPERPPKTVDGRIHALTLESLQHRRRSERLAVRAEHVRSLAVRLGLFEHRQRLLPSRRKAGLSALATGRRRKTRLAG